MCQIALYKSPEKLKKNIYSSDSSDNSEKKSCNLCTKEQFDTFENQCDVLRAAFCDSRYVFLTYSGPL